ncbi:MAG: ABC transporter permease [Armatimonadota bacterium]
MLKELAELFRFRELLMRLVVRDIKVRYKNSVLGFLWSLLNPLLQVAAITFAFRKILSIDIPNYSAYLLCAFLPWTFFQMSVLDASMSIIMQSPLVKKSYFPREILPISIVLSNLVHFLLALVVFFVYLLIRGTGIQVTWLLFPVLVIIQLFFNMGIALFVSAMNVFYEDVKYMVTVLLNLLMFLMPVMYMVENSSVTKGIAEPYRSWIVQFYNINPLSFLLTAFRKILLPPFRSATITDIPLNYWYLALSAVISLLIFIAGYAFFNKRKWYFAERL